MHSIDWSFIHTPMITIELLVTFVSNCVYCVLFKGIFDNSMMSAKALRDLWRAHHSELREIPIADTTGVDVYNKDLEVMRAAVKRNEVNNRKSGKVCEFHYWSRICLCG